MLWALALGCILSLLGTLAQSPVPSSAPAFTSYLGGPGNEAVDGGNYAVIAADQTDNANLAPCETTTFPIYLEDLVGMSESSCQDSAGHLLPYGQSTPFGITWQDDSPTNCSILSLTIAIQAGYSCAGTFGSTSLNGYNTPSPYDFPYGNEYNGNCTCEVPPSPLQVFNFYPQSAYRQGGKNTFLITNSTGDNGLRDFVPNANVSVFGLVITNQWRLSASLDSNRTQFGFTTTPEGTILVAGGVTTNGRLTATAVEYFPTESTWNQTVTPMTTARQLNQIAALQEFEQADSRGAYYLVTSGGVDELGNVLNSAELYNTSGRTWSTTAPMQSYRARHTLTSIGNGTRSALAVGGFQGSLEEITALNSIEIYGWDGDSWYWTPENMTYARYRHQTVVLSDWTALIMGGQGVNGSGIAAVESLSFATGNVTTMASMYDARYAFTATVLQNGSVLVVAGAQLPNSDTTWQNSQLLSSCEIYVNGTWYQTGSLTFPRAGHQAVLTEDGSVLVMGGGGVSAQTASELWNNVTGQWVTIAPLPVPKINFGVARLPFNRVLAFGGSVNSTVTMTTGTASSFMYTAPFSLADQSVFLDQDSVAPSPSVLFDERDSYRAPPITNTPPVEASSDVPSNALFDFGPLPANASFNLVLEEGLSAGTIGGIVGGVAGGAVLIAAILAFILYRRRKRRRAKRYSPEGLEKIQSQYGSGSLGGSPPPSGTLVYREDGTPVYLYDSRQKMTTKSPPLKSATDSLAHQSRDPGNKNSFQMGTNPLVHSSPFEDTANSTAMADGLRSGGSGGQDYASSAVMMPRGIPSPFGMDSGTFLSHKSSGGLTTKGLKSLSESTTTDGGTRTSDTYGSGGVPISRGNERSAGSDLSRVSYAVRHELESADWRVDRSALILEKRLGKGGFGEVFRGQHHGSPVAIKVLEISDDRTMQDACQEFGHLHNLRHSKLVVSYGACVDGANMLLVMELMEEDLFHAIANDATGAGDSVLWNFRGWQIAVDVASALVFLHSKGRVHLDVKSLNILLKGRRTEAKLGDLGLAKLIPEGHLALQNTLPGTPAYSAPEVLEAQLSWRLRTQGRRDQFHTQVGTPADVFAFGVVLFEICTGQHPARWRQDFEGTFRPDQAPPEVARLVDNCLQDEPADRPTARQLLDVLLQNKPKHLK